MIEKYLLTLRNVNRALAYLIGGLLIAFVAFVLADIVSRQFASGLGGTEELGGYVMALAVSWGCGYALVQRAHIRIDLLRSRVPQSGKLVLDLVALLSMIAVACLVCTYSWPVVERSIRLGSTSNTTLEIPLWIVQLPWFLGWCWFLFTALSLLIIAAFMIFSGQRDRLSDVIGIAGEGETAS